MQYYFACCFLISNNLWITKLDFQRACRPWNLTSFIFQGLKQMLQKPCGRSVSVENWYCILVYLYLVMVSAAILDVFCDTAEISHWHCWNRGRHDSLSVPPVEIPLNFLTIVLFKGMYPLYKKGDSVAIFKLQLQQMFSNVSPCSPW